MKISKSEPDLLILSTSLQNSHKSNHFSNSLINNRISYHDTNKRRAKIFGKKCLKTDHERFKWSPIPALRTLDKNGNVSVAIKKIYP